MNPLGFESLATSSTSSANNSFSGEPLDLRFANITSKTGLEAVSAVGEERIASA